MSVYADSSAAVKLYADEPDSDAMRDIEVLVVSELARVEIPAALWRKVRTGELTPAQGRLLCQEFEADYFGTPDEGERLIAVVVTPNILDRAAQLCAVHALRAYDAVQLGTALSVRDGDPECRTFAAFDITLMYAASAEGFSSLGYR